MQTREVKIPLREAVLEGEVGIPAGAEGIVLFAHGSGSSRHSPRNQEKVARLAQEWFQRYLQSPPSRGHAEMEGG